MHLNCSLVFQPSYSEFQISVSPTCTIPPLFPSGAVSVVSLVYRTPADSGSSREAQEAQSSIYPPFKKNEMCFKTLTVHRYSLLPPVFSLLTPLF